MSALRLIGIAEDQPRLERLATTLCAADFLCDIDIGTPETPDTATAVAVPPTVGSEVAPPVRVIDIICWTQASVGPQGTDLRARAVTLKENNDYLGLLLDDVEVPQAVTSAQDVRLIGWEAPDDRARLAPLIDILRERIEGRQAQMPAIAAALAAIRQSLLSVRPLISSIAARLDQTSRRVKAIGLGTILLTLMAFYGFFADVRGTQDLICSAGFLKETCRDNGWGHIPTLAQEQEWETARTGKSCEAFAGIYGRGGPFAEEAKRRLDLVKMEPARKDLQLGLRVPNSEQPLPDVESARSDLAERAKSEASRTCEGYAQAYAGLAAPARFETVDDPKCEARDGGFACTVDGYAICPFMVKGQIETCPPPTGVTGQ